MIQYKQLAKQILEHGNHRQDRTGTGTQSYFGVLERFDLNEGFPLLGLREINFKTVVAEIVWFLEGSTCTKRLNELGARIWDKWAGQDGTIGPMYGHLWRNHREVDQIGELVHGLIYTPYSRRHVVVAWDASLLPPDETTAPSQCVNEGYMALAPCHPYFECYVRDTANGKKLDLHFHMRSQDLPIGMPFNVAGYALLTHILANTCGYGVGELVYTAGDIHIYQNQRDEIMEVIERPCPALPKLSIPQSYNLAYVTSHLRHVVDSVVACLEGYTPHPPVKIPVAV